MDAYGKADKDLQKLFVQEKDKDYTREAVPKNLPEPGFWPPAQWNEATEDLPFRPKPNTPLPLTAAASAPLNCRP